MGAVSLARTRAHTRYLEGEGADRHANLTNFPLMAPEDIMDTGTESGGASSFEACFEWNGIFYLL